MRFTTLAEIDAAGHDIRAWCFACGRGGVVANWHAMADKPLAEAARRFRCKGCRSSANVLLLPARNDRRRFKPAAEGQAVSRLVEAWFFGERSKRKRPRSG